MIATTATRNATDTMMPSRVKNERSLWLHAAWRARRIDSTMRSEEHTSELQSRSDLVCRLLLEKKKTKSVSRCYLFTFIVSAVATVADHAASVYDQAHRHVEPLGLVLYQVALLQVVHPLRARRV